MKLYLYCLSFLNTEVAQDVEIQIFIWSPKIDQKIFFSIKPIIILLAQGQI